MSRWRDGWPEPFVETLLRLWTPPGCPPAAAWHQVSRNQQQSRVFRVGVGATMRYVKVHRSAGKYRRERDGLRRLGATGLAPALLDCRDRLAEDDIDLNDFTAVQLATSHTYNLDNARRDLGYDPAVSVDEGTERIIAWLKDELAAGRI